jgi:hypothetical protein
MFILFIYLEDLISNVYIYLEIDIKSSAHRPLATKILLKLSLSPILRVTRWFREKIAQNVVQPTIVKIAYVPMYNLT